MVLDLESRWVAPEVSCADQSASPRLQPFPMSCAAKAHELIMSELVRTYGKACVRRGVCVTVSNKRMGGPDVTRQHEKQDGRQCTLLGSWAWE